ncbi:malonyl-ACP O-methyltransferase BioC [Psychromonas sp. KJ10-2]|uniref:malonyl-ACP O-methyltransferase BioC n=1 Tax=Psychromonas sp. KJ10-2 TaxID=3391822 RepID=UPI0039B39C45
MQITIDKQAVQASFSKAASRYDIFADLQREIGHQLLGLVDEPRNSASALDLGCGTGYFSQLLNNINTVKQLTCFDLSPAMLAQVKQKQLTGCRLIEGDIDNLPFEPCQFDLVFSSLVLQWSQDLTSCLKQIKQVLNDKGTLYFSTLLTGSLFELEQAWLRVDKQQHINQFLSKQQVTTALQEAGFTDIELGTETRIKRYPDIISVMKALKGIGANHVHGKKQDHLSGKQLLEKLAQGYQAFVDDNGMYCLSYQVCYVVAKVSN